MIAQIGIMTKGKGARTKPNRTSFMGSEWIPKAAQQGSAHAPSCSRKGYKCPRNEEGFEDMVRKDQQFISHVAEDENLPQEVDDFKELQIIKRD